MSSIKPFGLRLPPELKTWVEAEAKRNFSSQNNEIVRAVQFLREHRRQQTKAAPEGVGAPAEA